MRIVLREATNTEQTVQRAAHFMTMNQAEFGDPQREIAVALR